MYSEGVHWKGTYRIHQQFLQPRTPMMTEK